MPNKHRYRYIYEGPVMEFDTCIDQFWHAETYAPTEKKALSNLAYRYKRNNGRAASVKITLPGKIKKEA